MSIKKNIKNIIYVCAIFIIIIVAYILLQKYVYMPYKLEKVKESVVKIEVYDDSDRIIATGSGFCAYQKNYILTNFHVIEGGYKFIIITDDNKSFEASDVLIYSSDNDTAILKIDGELKPLKIKEKKLRVGNNITAIGSPKGELNTVSQGIISSSNNDKGIQISAAISHGSSGGALFDNNYDVIGMTYAGYDDAQNINYAISSLYLNKMYDSLINEDYEKVTKPKNCIDEETLEYNGCGVKKEYIHPTSRNSFYISTSSYNAFYDKIKEYSSYTPYSYIDLLKMSSTDEYILNIYNNYKYIKENLCNENCNTNNIANWDKKELLLHYGILNEIELAIIIDDLENYTNVKDWEKRINEYNKTIAEKQLIEYMLKEIAFEDIYDENKEAIFDYFDSKINNVEELGNILELLGYEIEYEDDGTLTAYW